jgi:hypothetical protein
MKETCIVKFQSKIKFPSLFPPNNFFSPSFSFQEEKNIQPSSIQNGKDFLIEIAGTIPRKSLIRKLLLFLFPHGINHISARKIKRSSEIELFEVIGENLELIKS